MELNEIPENEIAALTIELLPLFIEQELQRLDTKPVSKGSMKSVLLVISQMLDDIADEHNKAIKGFYHLWSRARRTIDYYAEMYGTVEIPDDWEPQPTVGLCDHPECDKLYELGADDHCGNCGNCWEHCSC